MYGWRSFVDKVKRYFPLEKFEKRGLLITIVVLGFIFSFRQWGIEKFDVALGFQNFIISIFLVAIAFLVHEIAHRTVAIWLGYKSQFKAWITGLIVGLVVAFVSNGYLLFLAPGALVITRLELHRIGRAYHETCLHQLGWIAMSGPIANMLFAVLLKAIQVGTGSAIIQKLMVINIWIALFDMLPIPPFNGSRTFFGSRFIYVFVLGSLVGCAALLMYLSGIVPIIGALVLGTIVLLIFFVYVDKRW